jgi:hypothetical protein
MPLKKPLSGGFQESIDWFLYTQQFKKEEYAMDEELEAGCPHCGASSDEIEFDQEGHQKDFGETDPDRLEPFNRWYQCLACGEVFDGDEIRKSARYTSAN